MNVVLRFNHDKLEIIYFQFVTAIAASRRSGEVVFIVKGEAREIRETADLLKAAKSVKSGELTAASTGRKL